MKTHGMTITGAKGKVKRDLTYWTPTLKEFRAWAKANSFNADAYIEACVQKQIKHRAINLKAQAVREELDKGKAKPDTIKAWIEAAKAYRPNQERSRGIVSQKQAQAIMLKLASENPEEFARLMQKHS